MIKKFVYAFILIIFFVGIFALYPFLVRYVKSWLFFSYCDKQITYKLGDIDSRFNLSNDRLLELSDKSAKIWNDLSNKSVFVYDPDSDLDINLVYDARQENIEKINAQKDSVENKKINLDINISEYEQKKNEIKTQMDDLNAQIEYWNNRGGAPAKIYTQLKTKQDRLQIEINNLNKMGEELNKTTDDINLNITGINENVNKFNELLNSKPEEGLFIGDSYRIEIYIYENDVNFVNTLAHEMGHAMGFSHTSNPDSLMYKASSQKASITKDDIDLMTNYCKEQNRLMLFVEGTRKKFDFLLKRINDMLTYFNG